ncbi:MAG: hypothetical protein R3B99_03120 [Polyangiales bacterium]
MKRTPYPCRVVKSKTPWRPGSTPVRKVVQFGSVAGGCTLTSRAQAPFAIKA